MPVNVLILGGGSIGERHLRCFQQIGCQVELCESNAARRVEIAERYHLPRAFTSLDDACSRAWDAAVICTPAHLHVAHAKQLAACAPALLIEKPLATRVDEAEQLPLALAGKTVGVAYVLRVHPAVAAVRQLLAERQLGELLQVVAVAGQHFPTFRPAYREIYYANRATGGGAIQDAATHMFNLVQSFTGPFEWVFCDYAHQALEGVEVEDTVHLVARARGGRVMVSLSLNQFNAPNENVLRLNGARGSAQIRFHEHRYGVCYHGGTWQWSEPLLQDRDDLFRLQARVFLDAAAGKGQVACTLEEALETLRVNLAALESRGELPRSAGRSHPQT
jgi:predicted dehydrogenase